MSLEDIFTLPSEYSELRSSVRALSEKEIAPFAQAVDADHRYPQEAHNALVKAGLFAAHVPTEFGGDGADALADGVLHSDAGVLRIPEAELLDVEAVFHKAEGVLERNVRDGVGDFGGSSFSLGGLLGFDAQGTELEEVLHHVVVLDLFPDGLGEIPSDARGDLNVVRETCAAYERETDGAFFVHRGVFKFGSVNEDHD